MSLDILRWVVVTSSSTACLHIFRMSYVLYMIASAESEFGRSTEEGDQGYDMMQWYRERHISTEKDETMILYEETIIMIQ